MPHILVVDDDHRVRDLLNRYFSEEGFEVTEAADGAAMRAALAGGEFDLVLLDLVIPGDDGLVLAREIRAASDLPIIMLTGKGKMLDRVIGLEMGADDYITKPFHLREVLARVKTVLRRRQGPPCPAAQPAPAAASAAERLVFADWELDLGRRELRRAGSDPVDLTTGEFNLLQAFAQNPQRVLNRDQLMDLARHQDWNAYDRSIDTQVGRLRKKIENDPAKPELIKTVRGVGYTFAVPVVRR